MNVISTAQVNTLEDAQRTSSVLGTVTKETDEVSAEAQVCEILDYLALVIDIFDETSTRVLSISQLIIKLLGNLLLI